MERKTIGTFIAALRRTNGMTQKELAERLGVSDKTVSHWEREESAPDLTMIPVLAEIFHVTCEEILRGERMPAPEGTSGEGMGSRAEKQMLHLLGQARTKFQTRSMIAAGLPVLGLLSAMIFNFGFQRAYIGFFAACVFYTAAFICGTVFCRLAFASYGGDEWEGEERNRLKAVTFRDTIRLLSLTMMMLGASAPLVLIARNAYQGVLAGPWFLAGLLGALVALLLCHIASLVIMDAAIGKGMFRLDEQQDRVRRQNNALKARIAGITAAFLIVTFIGQMAFVRVDVTRFAQGTVFQTFEDFKTYIETPKESSDSTAPDRIASDCQTVYYDSEGREISREEALRESFLDADGNEVYAWQRANQEVASIRWGEGESYLPITVFTHADIQRGVQVQEAWNSLWIVLYLTEAAASGLLYWRKRGKA